jgi:DNA-directed RNA polymerase subunit RPC12/RpoP
MDFIPECKKCGKKLSSTQSLEKHLRRKIPCDNVIKCEKCDHVFKTKQLLVSHQKRKTPCEPIVGNPTKPTPKNACMFCGRQLSSKQSV